jgi:hypothetical protein
MSIKCFEVYLMSTTERKNHHAQPLPQPLQIEEIESLQFNANTPITQRIANMDLPLSDWSRMEQEIEAEHLKEGCL